MKIIFGKSIKAFVFAVAGSLTLVGCVEDTNEKGQSLDDINDVQIDVSRSNIINIGGELFSIPSPIETALMMKESGAHYDGSLVNNPDKASSYTSKSKKALNLGIYGADLGYVTIYDNTADALKFLKVVEGLLTDLGVTGALNQSLLTRLGNNVGNQDSLLVLVGEAFKAGDQYLKNNERNDVAGFILAGGFVEALYFATNVANHHGNEQIINRIGEQKESLNNLIKLLMHNYDHEEYELILALKDLYKVFESIEYTYEFVKPEPHPEDKITYVLSESKVNISEEQLEEITIKVAAIRNQMTK